MKNEERRMKNEGGGLKDKNEDYHRSFDKV